MYSKALKTRQATQQTFILLVVDEGYNIREVYKASPAARQTAQGSIRLLENYAYIAFQG